MKIKKIDILNQLIDNYKTTSIVKEIFEDLYNVKHIGVWIERLYSLDMRKNNELIKNLINYGINNSNDCSDLCGIACAVYFTSGDESRTKKIFAESIRKIEFNREFKHLVYCVKKLFPESWVEDIKNYFKQNECINKVEIVYSMYDFWYKTDNLKFKNLIKDSIINFINTHNNIYEVLFYTMKDKKTVKNILNVSNEYLKKITDKMINKAKNCNDFIEIARMLTYEYDREYDKIFYYLKKAIDKAENFQDYCNIVWRLFISLESKTLRNFEKTFNIKFKDIFLLTISKAQSTSDFYELIHLINDIENDYSYKHIKLPITKGELFKHAHKSIKDIDDLITFLICVLYFDVGIKHFFDFDKILIQIFEAVKLSEKMIMCFNKRLYFETMFRVNIKTEFYKVVAREYKLAEKYKSVNNDIENSSDKELFFKYLFDMAKTEEEIANIVEIVDDINIIWQNKDKIGLKV